MNAKIDTQIDTKNGHKMDAKIDIKMDPKMQAQIDTKIDTQMGPKMDPKIDAKPDTQNGPQNEHPKRAQKLQPGGRGGVPPRAVMPNPPKRVAKATQTPPVCTLAKARLFLTTPAPAAERTERFP